MFNDWRIFYGLLSARWWLNALGTFSINCEKLLNDLIIQVLMQQCNCIQPRSLINSCKLICLNTTKGIYGTCTSYHIILLFTLETWLRRIWAYRKGICMSWSINVNTTSFHRLRYWAVVSGSKYVSSSSGSKILNGPNFVNLNVAQQSNK